MGLLRWLGRALLLFIMSSAILFWVTLTTFQATLLNRQVVFGWLSDSGVYGKFIDTIVTFQAGDGQTENNIIDQKSVKDALQLTLTPSFIRQSTEKALGATYDWLDGTSSKIDFSIPLAEKRQEFIANLATVIQPKLAALPPCNTKINISTNATIHCLPANQTAQQMAQSMAEQSLGASGEFLAAPITPDVVLQSLNAPQLENPLSWLHGSLKLTSMLVIALPIVTILAAGLFVLLSEDKKKGIIAAAQYVLFNVIFFVVIGGVVWYFGGTFDVGDTSPIMTNIVLPLLHRVLPTIGMWYVITSGAVTLLCALLWIGVSIWRHHTMNEPRLSLTPQPERPAQATPLKPKTPQPAQATPKPPKRVQ